MNSLAVAHEPEVMQYQQVTVDLCKRFIQYLDAGSQRTTQEYAKAINKFIKWTQIEGIGQPQREDVIRYRDMLRENYKPATVQLYIIAVRQFFRWTLQEGIYPNVADNVKSAKSDRIHKKDALTTRQAQYVLETQAEKESLQGKRDYAILAVAMTGGLRTIEIQRANVEDLRNVGDHTVLFIQGKGHDEKGEYIIISNQVEKIIRDYLKARGKVDKKAPLFSCVSNRNQEGRMTTRSISRIVKNAFIECGLDSDRLTAHSLRHTAGTLNLLNGGTLQETQQLLRHVNVNTTLIYAHNLERVNNKSEERISSALFQ